MCLDTALGFSGTPEECDGSATDCDVLPQSACYGTILKIISVANWPQVQYIHLCYKIVLLSQVFLVLQRYWHNADRELLWWDLINTSYQGVALHGKSLLRISLTCTVFFHISMSCTETT